MKGFYEMQTCCQKEIEKEEIYYIVIDNLSIILQNNILKINRFNLKRTHTSRFLHKTFNLS